MASKEYHNDLSITGRLKETAEGISGGLSHGVEIAFGLKIGEGSPEAIKHAPVTENRVKELSPFRERRC
ncbi:hypothetical protein PSACC_03016 [Paramicrosporidium saccamoebae]|uniref:Uncharacterized protein n=1 Tax=Paramicrosporidium saccamoebae TaxID=1246581 RepID=A0A2H9THB9_9FUNG|nr:hypothetical protein PSACC_03016 [Paramicrosporidium saccamoebae]